MTGEGLPEVLGLGLAQGQDSQDEASDCRAGSGGRCPSLVLWEDECAASGSHLAVGRLRKC